MVLRLLVNKYFTDTYRHYTYSECKFASGIIVDSSFICIL